MYSFHPCISLQCHFIPSHIRKEHVFLAVPCPLHLWQNDRDLSRASLVTRGWNGYRNKNQHRILNLEKNILPPLQPGLEPATFRLRVRRFMTGPSPFTHRTRIKQILYTHHKTSPRPEIKHSVVFSSDQDGIYALGNAHMCSTPSLRSFPSVAFETVPMFVRLTMALSRPFKEDCVALPLSTPLSFRPSMV